MRKQELLVELEALRNRLEEAEDTIRAIRTGHVDAVVASGPDVTGLRSAEKALGDSEERLTLALQASQEGVWDWNLETNAAWYSSRWREMLGYEESEIEPDVSFWEGLIHPDDKARAIEMVDAVRRGIREIEMECRFRHRDGHYVDILCRGAGLRREPGGPIVRIVGTHFDLTGRKRAEEALRESVRRESPRNVLLSHILTVNIYRQIAIRQTST